MPSSRIEGLFCDLDHDQARLELLGAVAHEVRPVLGAGDQLVQVGQHLAAVADAEREAVRAREEGLRTASRARGVEQDRLGPALAGAQHVAVGEAAAGDQALEVGQSDAGRSRRSLMCTSTHSKPARSKAAAISTWPLTPCSRRIAMRGRAPRAMKGAAMSSLGIEAELRADRPGSSASTMRVVLLVARSPGCRAAPASAKLVSDQACCSSARGASSSARRRGVKPHPIVVASGRRSRGVRSPSPASCSTLQHVVACRACGTWSTAPSSSLNSSRERRRRPGRRGRCRRPRAAGEGHLAQGGEQAAVGAVVVGEQQAVAR